MKDNIKAVVLPTDKEIIIAIFEDNGFDKEYVEENIQIFGDDVEALFHFLFIDGNESNDKDLIKTLADIDIKKAKRIGAATVKEYMVFNHENVWRTPFGLVYLKS